MLGFLLIYGIMNMAMKGAGTGRKKDIR